MDIEGLSDYDIVEWCKTYKIPLQNIYMRDEIGAAKKLKNGFYIINFDASSGGGTHWVCLFINKQQNLYFDPLATPVIDEVLRFNVLANTHALQSDVSKLCGHWRCAFMFYITNDKGKSYSGRYWDFIHVHFDTDTKKNELKLVNEVFYER